VQPASIFYPKRYLQSRVGAAAQVNAQQAEWCSNRRLQLRQTIQQSFADALAVQRRFTASSPPGRSLLQLAFRNAEIRFNKRLASTAPISTLPATTLVADRHDSGQYEFFVAR
jgi:outer membrane protein